MKKIVTVSVLAIMAVSAANADIASTTYVDKAKTAVEGQITNLSGVVDTKAAQADLTALGTRVSTAEGKITDNTTEIGKKAAQTVVDALSGKVGDVSLSGTNYMKDDTNLTAAVKSLDTQLSNVAGGNLAIKPGAVGTTELADGSVTEAKLGADVKAAYVDTGELTAALKPYADNTAGYQNADQVSTAISTATTTGVIKQALDGKVDDSEIANMAEKSDIHDNTLTITVNNANGQTFTANAAADKTINIPVPTKVSDLTNDSKFQTESEVSSAISTATTDMATNSGVTETLKSYATTASLANATVANAGHATTADKATGDAKGNNIEATYATKVEVAGYVDPTELNTALKDYSTTIQMNSAIAEATADMATDGEVSTVKNELTTEINKKANQSDLTALTTGLGSLADVQIPELPGECKGTDATADCTLVIAVGADNALTAKWEKVAR